MKPIPCYRCSGNGQIIVPDYFNSDFRPGSITYCSSQECPDCLGQRVLYRPEEKDEVVPDEV